jgi:transcription antitermination protein NusB
MKLNPAARHWARRLALQAIYQWQMTDHNPTEILLQFSEDENITKADNAYFQELVQNIPKEYRTLDESLSPFLQGRKLEELDPVELVILRMAAYEFSQHPEIPYRVIINEAIELTKKFGAQDSFKYVNGVLDQLARKLRPVELS